MAAVQQEYQVLSSVQCSCLKLSHPLTVLLKDKLRQSILSHNLQVCITMTNK